MLDSILCRDDCVAARSRPLSSRQRPYWRDGASRGGAGLPG